MGPTLKTISISIPWLKQVRCQAGKQEDEVVPGIKVIDSREKLYGSRSYIKSCLPDPKRHLQSLPGILMKLLKNTH